MTTLARVLRERALGQGEALAFRHLVDGDPDGATAEWTYARTDRRAVAVAAALTREGARRERVLLLFDQDLHFLAAFFGCLYAGAVAVPTSTPDPARIARTLSRLRHIARDSGATTVLTTTPILALAAALGTEAHELNTLRWVAVDALPDDAGEVVDPAVGPDDVAFLQYTSGSTGDPKGVVVTHATLLANEAQISRAVRHDGADDPEAEATPTHVVSWLPMFHDMGLIGAVLHPVYTGGTCTFMSPMAFLQRPLAWLRALSRYRGDTAASPDFGYALCARRARPADLVGLDLSTWTTALSGAEPVRAETIERFTRTFGPCGLRPEALFPAYGLAEATLFVSGSRRPAPPRARSFLASELERDRAVACGPDVPGGRPLVSVGVVAPGNEVAIVRGEGVARCGDGEVGEIWLRGPSVAAGYWRRPEDTTRVFEARLGREAGVWLRTGDLGFVHEGDLYVAGRCKDVIIVRGTNHHPNDVEHTVERSHPRVRPGGAAAFGVERDGEERVVVVAEVDLRGEGPDLEQITRAIRDVVLEVHGLRLHDVVLILPRTLPKTSSGKVQRRAVRDAWQSGGLAPFAVAPASSPTN